MQLNISRRNLQMQWNLIENIIFKRTKLLLTHYFPQTVQYTAIESVANLFALKSLQLLQHYMQPQKVKYNNFFHTLEKNGKIESNVYNGGKMVAIYKKDLPVQWWVHTNPRKHLNIFLSTFVSMVLDFHVKIFH